MSISVAKDIFCQRNNEGSCTHCSISFGGVRKRCTKLKIVPKGKPGKPTDFCDMDVIDVLTEVYGISWSHIVNAFNRSSSIYDGDYKKTVRSYANGSLEMALCDLCMHQLAGVYNVFRRFEAKGKPDSILKRVLEVNKTLLEECTNIEKSGTTTAYESRESFSENSEEEYKIEDDEQLILPNNDEMKEDEELEEYKVEIKCEIDPLQCFSLQADGSGQMVENAEETENIDWEQNSDITENDKTTELYRQMPITIIQPRTDFTANNLVLNKDVESSPSHNTENIGRIPIILRREPRTDFKASHRVLSKAKISPKIQISCTMNAFIPNLEEADVLENNFETADEEIGSNSDEFETSGLPVATTSYEKKTENLDSKTLKPQSRAAKGLMYEALKLKGISEKGIQEVLSSVCETTWKTYNSAIRKWQEFCVLKDYEVFKPCIESLLAFLKNLNNQGSHFSTINTAQAAVSFLSLHTLGYSLSENPAIKEFRKNLLKPPPSINSNSWDPSPVVNYLSSLEPVEGLSIADLTLKTFGLLSLATGHRMSTLANIRASTVKVMNFGIRIPLIVTDTNRTGPKVKQRCIFLPILTDCPTICPARSLTEYLQRTQPQRSGSRNLFISFVPPFQDVKACTLLRWQKTICVNSGLQKNTYLPGCFKYASIVVLTQKGIPVKKIRTSYTAPTVPT